MQITWTRKPPVKEGLYLIKFDDNGEIGSINVTDLDLEMLIEDPDWLLKMYMYELASGISPMSYEEWEEAKPKLYCGIYFSTEALEEDYANN